MPKSFTIQRRGFTLFEIAISLALVTFAVTSMLVLFVSGIKTQQIARFKLYAAAKAEEMVESFASTANANPNIEVEGTSPWEVQAGYRALSPDLEIVIASHRYGIAPVPTPGRSWALAIISTSRPIPGWRKTANR